MEVVRLAIIGLGVIGKRHAERATKEPMCDVVAVADIDPAVEADAKALGATFYADYEALAARERIDGVIIATPNHLHTPVGVTFAELGVHLLVEKPIAETVERAERLIEVAERHRVRVLVGHHRRHNPVVRAAREIVRGGGIGRLTAVSLMWTLLKPDDYYHVPWRTGPGGGPILINLIHDIDNLRHICGEIESVYAETSAAARNFDAEDTGALVLRFEGGALGTAVVSDATPSPWSWEMAVGDNPDIIHVGENCTHFFGSEAALAFPGLEIWRYGDAKKRGWSHPLERVDTSIGQVDAIAEQLKHFCRVIRGEEAPRITATDATRTLAATLAVHEAARSGRPVKPQHVREPDRTIVDG